MIAGTGRHTGAMTLFSMLGWIVFGVMVGALTKRVMPGRDPGGMIVTIGLGIVGTLLGGWPGRAIGRYGPGAPAGVVVALRGGTAGGGMGAGVGSGTRYSGRRRPLWAVAGGPHTGHVLGIVS
jgi:uncharacterized membrane protein YeaQ/YmgE (transglycosylase-associated protein family)